MRAVKRFARLFLLLIPLALPQSALADRPITVGDGEPASCTQRALQDALEIAGVLGGGTIHFNCGPGAVVIALTEAVAVIDSVPRVASVAVVVPNGTTINGRGVVTLDGQFAATAVFVDRDTTAALQGLNITCSSDFCLAVYNRGTLRVGNGTFSNNSEGAIRNEGALTVKHSAFSNNYFAVCCISGGAIRNTGFATVVNSAFTGNTAGRGGALSNSGTLIVNSSVFSDNAGAPSSPSETVGGGTIYNDGGSLTVENSEISDSAPGAIWNRQGTATVDRSEISGNVNPYGEPGGAIVNDDRLAIRSSKISGNNAASGGSIVNSGTLTIDNSEISGNSAVGTRSFEGGGAIFNEGTLTITNSSVSENSAASFGGGIFNAGVLSVYNSTIMRNTANDGGGLYTCCGGTVELVHTAVRRNTPDNVVP
jgi:hypothetical protein